MAPDGSPVVAVQPAQLAVATAAKPVPEVQETTKRLPSADTATERILLAVV